MAESIRARLGSTAILALLTGCVSWPPTAGPRVAACPGPLVSTERIPGDLTVRHSARITADELELALGLVLEKRGDRLLVMGFSALGAKRFALIQTGTRVEVDFFGPPLAVPPENVLRDLHRVHFPRAVEQLGSGAPSVTVESGRSRKGQPMTRIENPACGYSAIYVTLSPKGSVMRESP